MAVVFLHCTQLVLLLSVWRKLHLAATASTPACCCLNLNYGFHSTQSIPAVPPCPTPAPTLLLHVQDCGGMLPWMGWRYFLLGTADPGNGGVLQQPRGQTSVFYSVPPPLDKQQQQGPQQQQAQQQHQGATRPAVPAADKGEEPGR